MDIKPISIDIFNIRQERQKNNNNIAIRKIQECNITEKQLLDECKNNIILTSVLAGRIAINASRQGIKDEIIQLDTLNITSSKLGINIIKLSSNLYRPTKYGEILKLKKKYKFKRLFKII